MRTRHWILLALGLTQVSWWAALLVVAWFFAFAQRQTMQPETCPRWRFNTVQIALPLLTLTMLGVLLALIGGLVAWFAYAQATGNLPAVTSTPAAGGGTTYSLTIQTLVLLTALTFIPAAVLMMTSFTRIIIVLSLLRHALGTQTSPPNQVLVGLALFLTFFIMSPTLDRVYTEAYVPLSENKINIMQAGERAADPMRSFMLKQTRQSDMALFMKLGRIDASVKAEQVPLRVLVRLPHLRWDVVAAVVAVVMVMAKSQVAMVATTSPRVMA